MLSLLYHTSTMWVQLTSSPYSGIFIKAGRPRSRIVSRWCASSLSRGVMNMSFHYGQHIGNYRLIAELGNGATGTVYLGVHAFLLQREVAVKLLHGVSLPSRADR